MTETSLFEHTRIHVEKAMLDLTGDDDFQPLIALRDHKGDLVAANLTMPDDGHDVVALAMTAMCTLHRATEVAFTSTAWFVERVGDEPMPDLPPSQCDDRQEIAMISLVGADGSGALHIAPVIRENNMVGVGLWEEKMAHGVGSAVHSGRFFDAITAGIETGQKMPPELAEYVDGELAAGRGDRLVEVLVRKLWNLRGGVQK